MAEPEFSLISAIATNTQNLRWFEGGSTEASTEFRLLELHAWVRWL